MSSGMRVCKHLILCHFGIVPWNILTHYKRDLGTRSGAGRIINLTSGQGLAALPDQLAYAATKGGVDALSLSMSAAVEGRGMTVNALDPGPTETSWMRAEQRAEHLRVAVFNRPVTA